MSYNTPCVDITSNMFLRDSEIASYYWEKLIRREGVCYAEEIQWYLTLVSIIRGKYLHFHHQ